MTLGPPSHLSLYQDRSLNRRAYSGSPIPYYSDSEPGLYPHRTSSSLSYSAPGFTSRLQDPNIKCNRNLGWNVDYAVAFIVDHMEKKTDAAETLRNVRIKAAALEREGLAHEIPYRVFGKLDDTLFAGHLKNAVFLENNSLGSDVSGATYNHSWGPVVEVKRVSIILNSDVLECARARDVVAILIHHMIHAYFLIACGPQKEDEVDYGRLGHGYHFGKIMTTIRKLSAVHGKELTPLQFGHDFGDFRHYADGYYKPRRRPSKDESDQKDKWYCSHCHSNIYEIQDSEIDQWYEKVCKPMQDQTCKAIRSATVQVYNDRRHELETKPRARLSPSNKTVEFIFKDRPILMETKKLDNLLSVKQVFEKSKSRFLKIDRDIAEATFHRLLEFAHTGYYRPDPSNHFAHGLGTSRTGPPVIKPSNGRGEAWLLADVQFAKFGSSMKFDECRSYALDRMNSYGIMTEDPVAVLEAIYSGREPDLKLKEWARKFLVASPTVSSNANEYFGGAVASHTEQPNLLKLENEHSPWRTRLHDAMDANGSLENDVRKAWQELRDKGHIGWDAHTSSSALVAQNQLSNFRHQNLLGLSTSPFHQPFQQHQQQLLLGANTTLDALNLANHHFSSPFQHQPQHQNNALLTALSTLLSTNGNPHNSVQNLLSNNSTSAHDLERLQNIERHKIRELEKERRALEKERDRVRETTAQVQAAAVLEALMGRGRGFVESDDEYC
ncbi:hypothetical protein CC86DRAFT_370719 [Ophiobolus disseminans]|uniref:SprT-like domain-containing protein n=1 Tax=Ophiobolus disseminans TaxID=1469910 RepID=A0A6A6ZXQ9_9PLEO|nr:hypothetical protein CC86DRAFT_370719 [Ophiobolus disseminans]